MELRRLLTLFIGCICYTLSAQQVTVTGSVTDGKDGSPLPGVSVAIENTSKGTTTDINGNYSIEVENGEALIFSFIGYASQKVIVTDQSVIDIKLLEDIMQLDEIVVTGYGVTKKSDVTGAVTSLKAEDFNQGMVTTPEELMQGRISGVQITSNSGEPGSGVMVQIRGANSIRSNTMPLYVIDGVPLDIQNTSPDGANAAGINSSASATNPLNFLNANDIESIDVLKDASASAIYGARAANGVIIVTTKRGKEGKSDISYSGYTSVSTLPKQIDVLSAEDWVNFRKVLFPRPQDSTRIENFGSNTNWQDEIFRTAYAQSHNLSLTGGTSQTQYRASFGFLDQEGIVDGSEMDRYTGRLNLSQKAINDKLNIEVNLTASQLNNSRSPIGGRTGFEGDLLLNAIMANPTMPVYTESGSYFQPVVTKRNPRAMIDLMKDNTKENRILGNVSASLEPIKGLVIKTNIGLDNMVAVRRINRSQRLNFLAVDGGTGDINNRELSSWLAEHTIQYSRTFADVHSISVLGGFSYQNFLIRGYNIHTIGYTSDEIEYTYSLETSDLTQVSPSAYGERNELQSFFGRINYNLMEKYLVTVTMRRDGSSKFGINNKYGNFPSVALAWRLSQEQFIENLNVFSNLKLRIGWGITGNQEIGSKHSLFSIGTSDGSKAIMDGSTVIPGYVLLKTPNENIKWESTQQTNIGVDFGFFKGRLSGTIDLFSKNTVDMLLETTAKLPAPTARQIGNVEGSIINKGIEVALTGYIVEKGDFKWNLGLNFTKINNTVEDLKVFQISTGQASGQGMTGVDVQVIKNGESINSFNGKKFLGFDQDGRSIFQDTDGIDGDDIMILGSPLPDYTFSVYNNFNYKNFDLNFFIQGVQGNLIYNNTANSIGTVANIFAGNNTFPNVVTSGENSRNRQEFSSRFLEDGSYIRLSNATIGYNINASKFNWINNLRIYVSGNNLFLITDYTGYDPDVNTDASRDNISSTGIDNTNYPKSRSFTLGLNVTF